MDLSSDVSIRVGSCHISIHVIIHVTIKSYVSTNLRTAQFLLFGPASRRPSSGSCSAPHHPPLLLRRGARASSPSSPLSCAQARAAPDRNSSSSPSRFPAPRPPPVWPARQGLQKPPPPLSVPHQTLAIPHLQRAPPPSSTPPPFSPEKDSSSRGMRSKLSRSTSSRSKYKKMARTGQTARKNTRPPRHGIAQHHPQESDNEPEE
nr:leiomodin-2-like [Setaria viridis]